MPVIDDEVLSQYNLLHNKAILFQLLDQPFTLFSPGDYVVKPNISLHGLGVGLQHLEFPQQVVVQPRAYGTYFNVDVVKGETLEYRISTGVPRGDGTFVYFKYLGSTPQLLSANAIGKIHRVAEFVADNSTFNMEFIGETVLEFHARGSFELESMYDHADVYQDGRSFYAVPCFSDVVPEFPGVEVHDIVEVSGKSRKSLVICSALEDAPVLSFSGCLA